MISLRVPFPRLILAAWIVATASTAVSIRAAEKKEEPERIDLLSWLLPKALQKNPDLELTVVTEVTTEGKKRAPVSPEHPQFFQLHSTGYKQHGDLPGGEKTLPPAELEQVLLRSLATNGYLPVSAPGQPFSLVIVYGWGTHYTLAEGDSENPVVGREQMMRNLLDRASLVGGMKFAREVREMLEQAADMNSAASTQLASDGEPPIPAGVMLFANPVNLFKLRDVRNEILLTQAANDVYYVVASAYDARSVAEEKRILLWRTRMTVGAAGVSQSLSLPALVRSAAPFFGRETAGAEVMVRRGLREGNVRIGPVREVEERSTSASPEKK